VVAPFAAATQSKGAVVSMADLSTLEVEADVSEANLGQVKLGQPCEIQLDALPTIRYRGEVRRIMPTVDKTKATVLVKVAFLDRDERILPDMSAKVAFLSRPLSEAQRVPVTAVSRRALRRRGANLVAFRVEGERAWERPVEIGQDLGDWAEIRAGLALGDRVVLDPPGSLRSGSRVRVTGAP
jgi:RND family efflux transporter MFP subunit